MFLAWANYQIELRNRLGELYLACAKSMPGTVQTIRCRDKCLLLPQSALCCSFTNTDTVLLLTCMQLCHILVFFPIFSPLDKIAKESRLLTWKGSASVQHSMLDVSSTCWRVLYKAKCWGLETLENSWAKHSVLNIVFFPSHIQLDFHLFRDRDTYSSLLEDYFCLLCFHHSWKLQINV